MSLGGYVCPSLEDLISGNWSGGWAAEPGIAAHMSAAGPEVVKIAQAIAQHFPVRVFVAPECARLAAPLNGVPGITIQSQPIDRIWMRDFAPLWLQKTYRVSNLLERLVDSRRERFHVLDLPYFPGESWAMQADQFPASAATLANVGKTTVDRTEYGLQNGNFQADSKGNCFYNQPVTPDDEESLIQSRIKAFPALLAAMGCRKQFALDPLPRLGTGHLDMSVMIGAGKNAFVAEFDPLTAPEAQAVMEKNYRILQGAGYRLHKLRTASPRSSVFGPDRKDLTYFSYANSLLNGNVAFVPQFGTDLDLPAVKVFEKAGYEVVPIRLEKLAVSNGTIHCVAAKSPFRPKDIK